jgi:hypothetical protein
MTRQAAISGVISTSSLLFSLPRLPDYATE